MSWKTYDENRKIKGNTQSSQGYQKKLKNDGLVPPHDPPEGWMQPATEKEYKEAKFGSITDMLKKNQKDMFKNPLKGQPEPFKKK